ncbi:hypothetical protein Zmor_008675, partial [Zophobas morio]
AAGRRFALFKTVYFIMPAIAVLSRFTHQLASVLEDEVVDILITKKRIITS